MNEDKRANNHKKQMVMKQFNKTRKMAWRLMVMAAMLGVLPLTAQRAIAECSLTILVDYKTSYFCIRLTG